MARDKKSFFERLTGTIKLDDEIEQLEDAPVERKREVRVNHEPREARDHTDWIEEEVEEGQLSVDIFQTETDIIIKAIVAGVKPEDLDISISRDMVTIRGQREEKREVNEADYFARELYWGRFARTISLPEEIEVEEAEASSVHGLLVIRLPKINKQKQTKLRVKTS